MNRRIDPNDLNIQEQDKVIVVSDLPTVICKTEGERIASVEKINRMLLGEMNALQAVVIWKQFEAMARLGVEINKDKAIGHMTAKEETVFGAKVAIRRTAKYEYEHPRLSAIEDRIAELKKEADDLRKVLRTTKMPLLDEPTGEIIQPAKLVSDGTTIAITLPDSKTRVGGDW